MMEVVKLTRKGVPTYWHLLGVGSVQFDSRPGWWLLAQPIGSEPKELQWIHPSDTPIEWARSFNF